MSLLETAIRNTLLSATGITNMVATRVRPLAMSQTDVFPYVTYKITDAKTEATLDGDTSGYQKAEFELGIYGATYDDVMNLSDLAKTKLDQFGGTTSGVEFAPCEFDTQTDIEEVVPEGTELPVYLRVQTYKCLYQILS